MFNMATFCLIQWQPVFILIILDSVYFDAMAVSACLSHVLICTRVLLCTKPISNYVVVPLSLNLSLASQIKSRVTCNRYSNAFRCFKLNFGLLT